MANKPLDTSLLDRAIIFAVRAHAGSERRGKGFPYIVHPMEAVEIVATMTKVQELLAAAALHDTVEDTDTTVEQIREEFGDRIASLVASESDTMPRTPRITSGTTGDWRMRSVNSATPSPTRSLKISSIKCFLLTPLPDEIST